MASLSNLLPKRTKPNPGGGGGSSPWPWLITGLDNITQSWRQNGELGVDMGLVMGTPITSLTSGTVLGSGYFKGGGVVSVKTRVNGQTASVYYQHFDLIAGGITPGAVVAPGQLLGWSGGQLQGGHHPASPDTSTGPHMEVGINAPIHAHPDLWHPLGPNVDPLPWLQSIASGKGPKADPFIGQIHQQATGHIPGFIVVCQALDQIEQFQPWNPPSNSLAGSGPLGGVEDVALAVQGVGLSFSYSVGWLAGNMMAMIIRTVIVILGFICLLLVLFQIVRGVAIEVQPIAQDIGAFVP